jgi:tetratricopeptide (TPR) repeat protein
MPLPDSQMNDALAFRPLSWLLSWLRRPWVWVTLLLAVALAVAGPYLWAAYAWHAAGQALARHRPRQARDYLERCLRVWPHSPKVHVLAARAARLAEDYAAAERHLTECQRLEGRESEASVLEWSLLRAEQGDLETVEDYLVARAKRDPAQAAPVLEALAAGYLRLYRFYDAMRCLEQCLERDPEDLRALYLRGRAWERVHAYPKAAEDYEQVVAGDPEYDEARLRLANSRIENGESAKAVSHLEYLRDRQPDNPEVLVRLAFAWDATGRLAQSLALIDEVLARHPDLPAAVSARGQLAYRAGRPAEAERWLRRALAANPFDRMAHYVLQQCLEQQDKRAEAEAQKKELQRVEKIMLRMIEITNRLMPKRPNDPGLQYELGQILTRMGHEELGVRWFHNALRHAPDYRPVHAALAAYYDRIGNSEQAAWHRERAGKAGRQGAAATPPG